MMAETEEAQNQEVVDPERGSGREGMHAPAVLSAEPRVGDLLGFLGSYRAARQELLRAIGCSISNRDPLAEFSERFVAALLGGTLAASRTQKGYDLTTADGRRVQVRYLANPGSGWVNEHYVDFTSECDLYSLAVFEDLDLQAVLTFDRDGIAQVCAALGKRHPRQDVGLQLTRRNYRQILDDRAPGSPRSA